MALIVQKFGGTSVASIDCIERVADRVALTRKEGHTVVVVVSAMSGQTDHLIRLAHQLTPKPSARELDVLMASGEQVTIALLAIALQKRGLAARSFLGFQVKIQTDSAHTKARILSIDCPAIRDAIAADTLAVIAGFQGMDNEGNVTTLGRGGSDTTAVAIAAALKADECQIYTDVDGVYTTDPRMVPIARRREHLTYDEMLELSSLGAKVLQLRAVEFASNFNVPLRVVSTFEEGKGTVIDRKGAVMEKQAVAGLAFTRDESKLVIRGMKPSSIAPLLGLLARASMEVDMVVQTLTKEGTADFACTVQRHEFARAKQLIKEQKAALGVKSIEGEEKVAKISLVGVGLRSQVGITAQLFEALAAVGIDVQLVTTSEIKVSVLVDEKDLELGVRTLHESFNLHIHPAVEA